MIRTLKILHIRKSGVDMEDPARTSRGNLFENLDMDSDDDGTADEDLGADPEPDVMMAYDRASGTSDSGESPSLTHSTASSESFADLLEFANWAFGPNGLPTLEVLAFGDFSHDSRFHAHNKLFCRHTQSIRNLENDTFQQSEDELILTFRSMRGDDRELLDLINRNTEFLDACPTDSIIND